MLLILNSTGATDWADTCIARKLMMMMMMMMMMILKSCLEPGLTHKTKIYDLLRDQFKHNTTIHLKH
jgi:hypothetical protein